MLMCTTAVVDRYDQFYKESFSLESFAKASNIVQNYLRLPSYITSWHVLILTLILWRICNVTSRQWPLTRLHRCLVTMKFVAHLMISVFVFVWRLSHRPYNRETWYSKALVKMRHFVFLLVLMLWFFTWVDLWSHPSLYGFGHIGTLFTSPNIVTANFFSGRPVMLKKPDSRLSTSSSLFCKFIFSSSYPTFLW